MISRDRVMPGLRAAAVLALLLLTAGIPVAASAEALALKDATTAPTAPDPGRNVEPTVWFQGFLADVGTGDPVNATYNINAWIYTDEVGGTLLWGPELHREVHIVEGWFNIELGAVEPPLPDFSAAHHYLQLEVNGEPLAPRSKLASVPMALLSSATVEDDGDWFIDGDDIYHEAGFVNIGAGPLGEGRDDRVGGLNVVGTAQVTGFKLPTGAAAGRVLVSDANGTGTWQTASGTIGGGGTSGYLTKFTGASTIGNSAAYESGGRIGIGTTTTTDARLTVETSATLPALALKTTSATNGPAALTLSRTQPAGSSDEMVMMTAPSTSTAGTWIHCYLLSQSGYSTPFMVETSGRIYSTGGADLQSSSEPTTLSAYSYYESSIARAIDAHHISSSPYDGVAVYGEATEHDFYGYGGWFEGGYTGAVGMVEATGAATYYGLFGHCAGGTGISMGTRGGAFGGGTNYGLYGTASGGSTNWAGYFAGNVRVTGAITNPLAGMEIDDPTDPANGYLRHPYVASNEMKTVYDGTVVLDASGEATVQMPDWFESLNTEFRYQLTAVGAPGPNLYIAQKVTGNSFRIAGGLPGMEVCWQVTGVRHDAVAAQRGFDVRVPKTDDDRGRYLDPAAHGVPADLEIGPRDEKLKD